MSVTMTLVKVGTIQRVVSIVAGILGPASIAIAFPVGNWSPAHATYYGGDSGDDGTMGGACGYGDMWSQGFGDHTTALSDVLFQNGERCGACYELMCLNDASNWCFSSSVIVTTTNNCPQGSFGGWCDFPREHFDLSVPAFITIAQKVAGVVPIQYRRLPCQKQGGIKFLITGSPNFQLVLIFNVGGSGDVQSVAISGDNTGWQQMSRNWSENWQFYGYLCGQSLSISVTTMDGANVVSNNVAPAYWEYGQTFEGSQFS